MDVPKAELRSKLKELSIGVEFVECTATIELSAGLRIKHIPTARCEDCVINSRLHHIIILLTLHVS